MNSLTNPTNWFDKPDSEYEKWVLEHILHTLQMTGSDRVCDLAGGTGRIAYCIRQLVGLYRPIVCVNPCPPIEPFLGVYYAKTDLLEYAKTNPKAFTKVLIREAIHHIQPEQLKTVLEMLIPKHPSQLLIIARSKYPNYPFSSKMQLNWAKSQPDLQLYTNILKETDLKFRIETFTFPVVMSQEEWLEMIRKRIGSCFSREVFSDDELEKEIECIKHWYPEPIIRFTEKLFFIDVRFKE